MTRLGMGAVVTPPQSSVRRARNPRRWRSQRIRT